MARLEEVLRDFWEYLRELCGENDYTRYCAGVLARGGTPMTPQDFYLWQQRQKYSRQIRCC